MVLTTTQIKEYIVSQGLPSPVLEHKFHPTRKWRFDIAWPNILLAIEIDGGTWIQGRHNRPSGFAKDCEKFNAATVLGWKVLRYTPAMINGMLIEDIKALTNWSDKHD
jgi:very-short-patch-repair endonuclease